MNRYFERIHEAISSTTEGMTAEQLQWHPQGKWSTCEILEHLLRTYLGTVKVFNRCLQAEKATATAPILRNRLVTFMILRLGYMPKGREAPVYTRPQGASPETIMPELIRQLATMDETILKCEERWGGGVKLVNHPLLGPLNASDWRKFHWVHARHHLRQIEQLKQLQLMSRRANSGS